MTAIAPTLILNSSQSCDCKTLTLTDASGLYNATTNPGGWDPTSTATLNFDDVDCATLKITLPDHVTIYYKDITSVFAGASSLSDLIFPITMTDLGGSSDGVYTIEYSISNTIGTPETTLCTGGIYGSTINYVPIYCIVQCCILTKIALIPQYYCCDACENSYVSYCMDLWMMLKALQTSEVSTSYIQFENILAQVQKLCNNEDCNCV